MMGRSFLDDIADRRRWSAFRVLLGVVPAALLLAGSTGGVRAYTPDNHERSVKAAAERFSAEHGITFEKVDLKAIIEGVLEPDKWSPALFQIVKQRYETGAYGTRRDISMERVAAQSFHGSPNPTRPVYSDSEEDQEKLEKAIQVPAAELLPDRLELDVYSYDTNLAVRNRMLINASQFLCVSFAHADVAQGGRKLGNMLHMIGDTYSASHVQRSEPAGGGDECGTEKIEWHFSMDLISWKLHRPADKQHEDWRFRCLVEHTSDLMKLWDDGRQAVGDQSDPAGKLKVADEHVGRTLGMLCDRVLREDAEVLSRPAGGAAAGYSIASGVKKHGDDRPIQPVGLTGAAEAAAFVERGNDELEEQGSPARFWYPSREMGDLCRELGDGDELPSALQCTAQEIDWAISGSAEVETLWIPPRTLP